MESRVISNIKDLSKIQRIILFLLFSGTFLIAIGVVGDYGIAWDDHFQIEIAKQTYEYVIGQNNDLFSNGGRFFGSAAELPLLAIQSLSDSFNNQVIIRHLIIHFYFLFSLYIFFNLLLKIYKSFNLALLGVLFLYLNPIIFAHSFFNSKDLPFLATFIISLYTMWLFINNSNKLKIVLLHSFITAFLIDIRLLGLLIPALTVSLILMHGLSKLKFKSYIKPIIIYGIVTIGLIYTFWPVLWPNPKLFINSIIKMASYPSSNVNLFLGNTSLSQSNPWYYLPLWIGVSMPIYITILYLVGVSSSIIYIYTNNSKIFEKETLITISLISIPIDLWVLFLVLKPTFYDGWRHLFFLSPLIIIGALSGFKYLLTIFKNKRYFVSTIKLGLTISIFYIMIRMIILHPYQQVYLNSFVSKQPEAIRKNWEMDYWGLSYKEGFEKLLEIDSSNTIKVKAANISAIDNWKLANSTDPRSILVDDIKQADYFITNYRFHPNDYPYKEVFSIKRQGSRILSIFSLKSDPKIIK